jgi:hypothetical protein
VIIDRYGATWYVSMLAKPEELPDGYRLRRFDLQ